MAKLLTILGLLFWGLPLLGKAQTPASLVVGNTGKMYSRILGEERPYYVYLPPSTSNALYSPQRYPVIYVLDGETQFQAVAAMVDRLSALRLMPEAVVVALPNTNRIRDLTPTHIESGVYMDRQAAVASGGAENFTRFLQQELIPHIDSTYTTTPYRMLVETSLGGLLVLNTLLHHLNLFQAYVAIDPSLWWDNEKLVREAGVILSQRKFAGKSLYVPVAMAFKATADTAASKHNSPGNRALLAVPEFIKLLEQHTGNGLNWAAKYYPEEGHNTVPLPGTYDALHHAFSAYRFLSVDHVSLLEPAVSKLRPEAVRDSLLAGCHRVSRQLGYSVLPPEVLVNRLGYAHLRAGQLAAAYTFFELNQANYPKSFNVYDAMGDYYNALGNKKKAMREFAKALTLHDCPETRDKLRALQRK